MRSPVADLLAALGTALAKLGIRWYLFGAQAALLHGAARLTADVDVTADLGTRPLPLVLDALAQAGFAVRVPDVETFAGRTRVVPLVHSTSGMPVDVVLAGPGLEVDFLRRARVHVIEGVQVPVASPEDVVVMKLLAGRAKDVDDAAAILAAHIDDLDHDLVRNGLNVIEQALDRSDLLPLFERLVRQARG